MIRPTLHPILCGTIARSPLTTSLFPLVVVRPVIVSSRTLTSSSRLLSGPNNPSHAPSTLQKRGIHDTQAKSASTALKPEVREKEKDQTGGRVVGDEVPGSEGPHYQGAPHILCLKWYRSRGAERLGTDQIPPTANPLHDMAGQWTMMNPIYSDAVSDDPRSDQATLKLDLGARHGQDCPSTCYYSLGSGRGQSCQTPSVSLKSLNHCPR